MLHKETIDLRALELLKALQTDKMFLNFHLAGGTGLALQLGHRISLDLDLFSAISFDAEVYLEYLEKEYKFILDFRAVNTLKGSIENIKVDFISHRYGLVKPIVETEQIRLYPPADIAAMKVNAIAGNGTRSKDFVDLYFLLDQYSVSQVLEFYETKYNDRNAFHALKSLNYFDEVDLSDWPVLIKHPELKWGVIKKRIDKVVMSYVRR